MLRLYDYWRSSAAYRVRIALNLKGLEYESVPVNIAPGKDEQFAESYRALNSLMRVPALETPQGVLTQSLAIVDWLDQVHPAPSLYPSEPWLRAQVRAFAMNIVADLHPLNNLAALSRIKSQFGADDAATLDWYFHWLRLGFDALEAQLATRRGTPFAFGDAPTLADLCLVPQMANARRFKFDVAGYPRLAAIDAHARAHPAFLKAAPENQKDAVRK